MITYCRKCEINWSRLVASDDDGEEECEVCPVCLTDLHLEEGNDTECYIKDQVTGRIINIRTRQEYSPFPKAPIIPMKTRIPNPEKYLRFEELQELAMENMADAIESGKDPREAFFGTFKKAK